MQQKPEKSLRQRALEYLGKREYSQQELAQKLKAFADENDDVDGLLADFKARGWLNDARFSEQIVHARQAKFGANKIAHELREKGVSQDLIETAIEQVKDHEFDNAKEIWRKKFKTAPASREEWAKQARFLQSRGFGFEIIKKVLDTKNTDQD